MVAELEDRRDEIAALCRKYGVLRHYVFGSVLSEDFRPGESDVDVPSSAPNSNPCHRRPAQRREGRRGGHGVYLRGGSMLAAEVPRPNDHIHLLREVPARAFPGSLSS
jgi:hypothetical protein